MPDDEKDEEEKWILEKIVFSFDFDHNLSIILKHVYLLSMYGMQRSALKSIHPVSILELRLLLRKEWQNLLSY